jgi:hypothetical protein
MTILPQLEQDLSNAANERLPASLAADAHQPAPSRSVRARCRVPAATVPIILSVVSAAAVAVIALVSLHHPAKDDGSSTSSGHVPPRTELIATLGPLRRLQTPADLDPALLELYLPELGSSRSHVPAARYIPLAAPERELQRWGHPALDRSLLRVVNLPAWRAKILIAPMSFQASTTSKQRTEGLNLALKYPGAGLTGTGPLPATTSTFVVHGLSVFIHAQNETNRGAVLVPDGIARVKLGPFQPALKNPLRMISQHKLDAGLRHLKATLPR